MLLGRGHATRRTHCEVVAPVPPPPLLLASLPLGAVATVMVLGRDPRRGWYITAGVLILIAVGLALLVSRRLRRVVRAIEGGARTMGQGEVPTLGPFPVSQLDDLAQTLVAAAGTRREVETKLRASETRLGAMISAAPIAIMCVDAAHRVIRFNRAAEALFGCTAADAVGGAADRFFSQRFLRVLDPISRARAGGCGPSRTASRRARSASAATGPSSRLTPPSRAWTGRAAPSV